MSLYYILYYKCCGFKCIVHVPVGVKVVAESLAHSQTPEAQECAQNLLHELSVVCIYYVYNVHVHVFLPHCGYYIF